MHAAATTTFIGLNYNQNNFILCRYQSASVPTRAALISGAHM